MRSVCCALAMWCGSIKAEKIAERTKNVIFVVADIISVKFEFNIVAITKITKNHKSANFVAGMVGKYYGLVCCVVQ